MTFKDTLAVYAQLVVVHVILHAQPWDAHVAHICLYRSHV